MKTSKIEEQQAESTLPISEPPADEINIKKRKANDEDAQDTIRKRRMAPELPEGFFDPGIKSELVEPEANASPMKIDGPLPSRPATPVRPAEDAQSVLVNESSKQVGVDEDEWAAFEADVASLKAPAPDDAIISAPAITAAEIEARSLEESNAKRKELQEAELEGDKEDAARKLEMEFEEMESLEERVRRLREKREELRSKSGTHHISPTAISTIDAGTLDVEGDDDEDEDDEWDGFRLRG